MDDETFKKSEIRETIRESTLDIKKSINHRIAPKSNQKPTGVLRTKIFTKEEINKMNEEQNRVSLLDRIIEFYYRNPNRWLTPKDISEGVMGNHRVIMALNQRIFKIL